MNAGIIVKPEKNNVHPCSSTIFIERKAFDCCFFNENVFSVFLVFHQFFYSEVTFYELAFLKLLKQFNVIIKINLTS